jgi:hypothetical protein
VSPAGSRALRPALGPGDVLAGRYRIEAGLPPRPGDPPDVGRWAAVDDVLARPVEVLLLLASGRRAARARGVLDAAAAAGSVPSPVLVQVYDAAVEDVPAERYGRPSGEVDVAYVVTEAPAAVPLAEVVRDAPLDPDAALALGLAGAEALAAAHARGVVHGSVSPVTALLDEGGSLRLDGTGVAAALHRRSGTPADDVRALAGVVYAALTARWPLDEPAADEDGDLPAASGLPPAPRRAGALCSPRQVRAGVPRHLDAALVRALDPAGTVRTAPDLLRLLERAAAADAAARPPVPRAPRVRVPRVPARLARYGGLAATAAVVAVVGLVGYSSGREFGAVQGERSELEALVDSTPSPVPGDASGPGARIDLAAPGTAVTAFDPPPGDGGENSAAVPNAVDGDPGTAWETEVYETSRFGGLKPGVGLLVDLGSPTAVEQVELALSPGTDVELRVGDQPVPDVDGYAVVAAETGTGAVARLVPEFPVTARFVLVWFTRLPVDGDGFRGSVREMFLVRP